MPTEPPTTWETGARPVSDAAAAPPVRLVEPPSTRGRQRLLHWLRWLLTPALMALALMVGVTVFLQLARLKELPPQVEPPARVFRVPVFLVQQTDVRPWLVSFGTALPDRQVTVAAEVAGRIIETQGLKVGTVLNPPAASDDGPAAPSPPVIRIDPETYQERILQAEALLAQDAAELDRLDQEVRNNREMLAQRQRTLESASEQLRLQQRLMAQGAGRETELRRTELEYQQYESAVLQLETELKLEEARRKQVQALQAAHQRELAMARLELKRSSVHAPFSGVVSRVMVEHGQYVRPGEPLFELTNLSRVELPLPVPLSRSSELAALLASGELPRVQLSEHERAECRWVGRVTRIAPVADDATRTVSVYAEVDNTQTTDPLRPGMFVHARIELGEDSGLLLVPRDAIVDGAVFVAVPKSGGSINVAGNATAAAQNGVAAIAERREIRLAGTLHAFGIVASGLRPGDQVVLTNLDVLKPGTLLSVVDVRDVQRELQRESIPPFEVVEVAPLANIAPEPRPQAERSARLPP